MTDNYYTRGEKEFLLKIARTALASYVLSREKFEPQTINQKLWERCHVAVNLWRGKECRGAAESSEPAESLILAVRDSVLAAARDSRFAPLEANELEKIKIEIAIDAAAAEEAAEAAMAIENQAEKISFKEGEV